MGGGGGGGGGVANAPFSQIVTISAFSKSTATMYIECGVDLYFTY